MICRAATEGPWSWADWSEDGGPNTTTLQSPPHTRHGGVCDTFPDLHNPILCDEEGECTEEDKAFIVCARQNMPRLLAEVRRQKKEIAALKQNAEAWRERWEEVCERC